MRKFTPKEILLNEIREECFFIKKLDAAERMHFYPFNKAAKVVLISFTEGQNIPVNKKSLDTQKVLEQTILNRPQIDSLTSLFYNVGFTPVHVAHLLPIPSFSCYEPRNGVLFLDDKGKVFEYLEICFQCMRTEKSSEAVNEGGYCLTKYDLLRNFFRSAGIQYGTGDRDSIESYKQIFKLDTMEALSAIKNKLEKKTKDGKDLSALNQIERTLFLTICIRNFNYGDSGLTDIAEWYMSNMGCYGPQTLAALDSIGAPLTEKALKASELQWPQGKVPEHISDRRAVLANIINKADPAWQKLEAGLCFYRDEGGDRHLIAKEDLDDLIFRFAIANLKQLAD